MNAIEIKELTKRYKDVLAVDHLSLDIRQGELFSLLGVNGAGKTTTIKMLSCVLTPTSGDALLLGDSIVKDPMAVKTKINISPQETAVAPNLSVRENLEMIAGIYGHKKEAAREKAEEMIVEFSLQAEARKRAKTLSGGMQRRLSIAMALISDPQILFLDEPTLGLDVLARRELWKVIEMLKEKTTMIMTTHYMEETEALSDRIGVLAHGHLKAVGTVEELKAQTESKTFEDAFIALAAGMEG
ncbi:ABC transporter ATP-binding protein (plasmid) [Chloroflexota bacterium]|nr:ABC transporter ATP-binding protein [Chloroflexota bacterium]